MSNGKGSQRRCSECGCKVRGSNHEEGQHHINKVKNRDEKRKAA